MLKLEDHRYDAVSCPRCSNCKWIDHVYVRSYRFAKICPISTRYNFNAYSAHGLLDLALALLDGRLNYTPRLLDAVYKCTLCGACDVRCKRNLDLEVLLTLEALRNRCIIDGQGPPAGHRVIIKHVGDTGNRYGAPREKRIEWLPERSRLTKKAKILYFVGCNHSYVQKESAKAVAGILKGTGSSFTLLGTEEWCCGRPLIAAGQWGSARELVQHNLETVGRTSINTVVTGCAECYKTWKIDYPRLLGKSTYDMGFRVVHIIEYAAEALEAGILSFDKPLNMKVTYHDPCHLGRLSEPWVHWEGERKQFGVLDPPKIYRRGTHGVYDSPRQLLTSIPGIELVEMERRRENAWCCGAGGGVRDAFRDFALWTAAERLEEVRSTGAEAVVTACPYCRENLEEAAQLVGSKVKLLDLAEVMFQALAGRRSS